MNIAVIAAELERRRIPYELLSRPEGEVAKTLILDTQQGYVRALVPASKRLDPTKVAVALALNEVRLVPESELVGVYPEFELGAIPPIAGPGHERVIADQSFREHPWLVFEIGRHDESLRVPTGDLLAATYAIVADICLD